MATEYTPEEIQRIFAEYNDAIKTGTPVTQELADRMRDAQKGVKGFSDEMRKTSQALGKSSAVFTKAMLDGAQGATAMNSAVDTVTSGLQLLINLIPGARLLKFALTALTVGVGAATKVINAQTDALFKSYQDMAKFGASGAGGMRDVFDNMQKFGYGIAELDKMTALIKENSEALASFGGTAIRGTQAFADAATQIQRSNIGRELQMLGQLPDDINRGMSLFIKQQQQSGMSNSQINQNLAQRSAEYIKNLDILSKLTGEDANKLQQKLDAAMAEDAFNQTIYELRKQEAAGDREAGKLANEYENAARRLTGEALKEFQQGVGGDISVMSKTMMTSVNAVSLIGTKAFTASGYLDELAEGAVQSREAFGGLAKFNATRDFILPMKELSLAESRYADSTAKNQEDLAKAQQELQQKGLDPATKAQVELRIEQMKARDNLQSFVNLGVLPATNALLGLAKAATAVSGVAPGKAGGGQPMGGGGGGGGGGLLDRFQKSGAGPGDLSGLRMKSAEATAGGSTSAQLATMARTIQDKLGGDLRYFSAFNDTYDRGGGSLHGQGRAMDFTLTDDSKAAAVAAMVASIPGISKVINEYANPSRSATGGHIHAEISAAAGAILSGPKSGYRPNLTMHGTEAIVPLDSASGAQALGNNAMNDQMLSMFSTRLEEMTRKISDVAEYTKKTAQYAGV